MVTDERRAEAQSVVRAVRAWAEARDDVRAVAIVGSWARDEPRMESDLDVVVLSDQKDHDVDEDGWATQVVGRAATVIGRREWGPLTERRLLLASGFEIDVGFVAPSWASTDPLDPGTAHVLRDGCRPLVDPHGLLAALVRAAR